MYCNYHLKEFIINGNAQAVDFLSQIDLNYHYILKKAIIYKQNKIFEVYSKYIKSEYVCNYINLCIEYDNVYVFKSLLTDDCFNFINNNNGCLFMNGDYIEMNYLIMIYTSCEIDKTFRKILDDAIEKNKIKQLDLKKASISLEQN